VSVSTTCPTTIVTVVPRGTREPPPGACSTITPSSSGSVTSRLSTLTLSPWARSVALPACWVSPITLVTITEPAPVDTVIVTSEPFGTAPPGPGSCAITVPSGSSESSVSTLAISPAFSMSDSASSWSAPSTDGTETRFVPFETRSLTT
jgi:hypothetical protein